MHQFNNIQQKIVGFIVGKKMYVEKIMQLHPNPLQVFSDSRKTLSFKYYTCSTVQYSTVWEETDFASPRVVEPLNERDDGALPTATGTHQSHRLPTRHLQREPLQNWDAGSSGVGKVDTLKLDGTLEFIKSISLVAVHVDRGRL